MTVPVRFQPLLMAIAACLALAAFAAYGLIRERDLAIRSARADTANLARLLDEQLRQGLRRVEATLAVGRVRVMRLPAAEWPGHADLQRQLRDLLPADGLVRGLVLFDSQGRSLLSTLPQSEGLADGIAERDWFQGHRQVPAQATRAELAIGRMEQDFSGRWVLPISQRVGGAGIDAVLVAVVDTGGIQQVFDALNIGSSGFVTLFLKQGWLLATAPANPALFARNWRDTPMFTDHLPHAPAGTVQQVVVRDQTERVYSYRALSEFPVVVAIGVSLTDTLSEWHARVRWNAMLLLAIAAALLAAAVAMARQHARRASAELALAEAAGQTRAIVDHVADAIVSFDAHGRVESLNPAGVQIFGRTAGELIGREIGSVVPALGVSPQGLRWADSEAWDQPTGARTEAIGQRGDGSLFPIGIALTQGLRAGQLLHIALVRDITEAHQAQRVLADARAQAEDSARFLRQVTDNLPLRIAYVDAQLRYRFVNLAHCQRFGLPREAIIGRTRQELVQAPTEPAVQAELNQVLQGETRRFEFVETVAGQRRVMESHVVPDVDTDGRVRGFYAVSTDVTERHQQQQRIELALAERETLLREVYHRVKNNLQVVQSLLSLQRRALPEGQARAALDDSVQRIRAMALVHEKLYQTGTLSAVDLQGYTEDLLRQIGEAAGVAGRGILLRAELEPVQAALDLAVPFGLLVAELVGNSLKHGFPSGRHGEVHVSLQRMGAQLRLRVADNGISLPAAFDLQHSLSMGLQLAASLAQQLGGDLQAHDEAGAVFTTQLPRLG